MRDVYVGEMYRVTKSNHRAHVSPICIGEKVQPLRNFYSNQVERVIPIFFSLYARLLLVTRTRCSTAHYCMKELNEIWRRFFFLFPACLRLKLPTDFYDNICKIGDENDVMWDTWFSDNFGKLLSVVGCSQVKKVISKTLNLV